MTNNIVSGIEIANLRAELDQLGQDLGDVVTGWVPNAPGWDALLIRVEGEITRRCARINFLLYGHLGGF